MSGPPPTKKGKLSVEPEDGQVSEDEESMRVEPKQWSSTLNEADVLGSRVSAGCSTGSLPTGSVTTSASSNLTVRQESVTPMIEFELPLSLLKWLQDPPAYDTSLQAE